MIHSHPFVRSRVVLLDILSLFPPPFVCPQHTLSVQYNIYSPNNTRIHTSLFLCARTFVRLKDSRLFFGRLAIMLVWVMTFYSLYVVLRLTVI